jgi:hypothetical protein
VVHPCQAVAVVVEGHPCQAAAAAVVAAVVVLPSLAEAGVGVGVEDLPIPRCRAVVVVLEAEVRLPIQASQHPARQRTAGVVDPTSRQPQPSLAGLRPRPASCEGQQTRTRLPASLQWPLRGHE